MIRRFVAAAFCIIICITAFNACGKGNADLNIDDIADMVEKSGSFSDMKLLSDSQISNYFNFSGNTVVNSKAYISNTENVADEYAVFEIDGDGDISGVLSAISSHMTNRQTAFRNASDYEYQKLQNAVIRRLNNFIILAVNENYHKIINTLEDNGAIIIK